MKNINKKTSICETDHVGCDPNPTQPRLDFVFFFIIIVEEGVYVLVIGIVPKYDNKPSHWTP